jgi:hypothetical protein
VGDTHDTDHPDRWVEGVARVDGRVVGDEQGDACAHGQHPTDDQNGGEREQTVEIIGRQNTKEAGYPCTLNK